MAVRLSVGGSVRVFSELKVVSYGASRELADCLVLEDAHIVLDGVEFFGRFKIRSVNGEVFVDVV